MDISLFDFQLPKARIAQHPAKPRDASKMLICDRSHDVLVDSFISQLPYILQKGDVLVFNNSKVIPARLYGKKQTGGHVELLLLHRKSADTWTALIGSRGSKASLTIVFDNDVEAHVLSRKENVFSVQFSIRGKKLDAFIERYGQTPTPPYIHRRATQKQYQTIYAQDSKKGSVAAPTAGLHFTKRLLKRLRAKGVQFEHVTLHVGLGTFAPVTTRDIRKHIMHPEFVELDPSTAERILQAKKEGRRIIAVGTTTVRTLEGLLAHKHTPKQTIRKWINPFFYPGYSFKVVDGMLTNFHLPKSTLVMLVSAFAGRKRILDAYQHAIEHNYRFYSFGDAMLIL